ncbi:GGDEF domain-containing protein, partial [uncultured Massilia sp.]|uniref:GGDEF domain-containing protein n=1 Tax=uncultured Massilia sp. TaxID=169973 RepID=UPI00258D75DD
FGILAGLRRHLGLRTGWKQVLACAACIPLLHALPFLQSSVMHRLFVFTPIIVAINLGVAVTLWNHVRRGEWAPYLPLAILELFFAFQLTLRAAYLILGEGHALTFMGSQFLQTSGSLFVLVFLSVACMSCALIVTHQQAQLLRRASLTDALTGWLNRRALHERAGAEFRRCRGIGGALFFITFDIDHFKLINDRHGHATGDAAIRHVTTLAAGALRGNDAMFRTGGEEFAVLVAQGGIEDVVAIAERLRELIAASPLVADNKTVRMTISVGVAQMLDADVSWEDLLRHADEALYHAKEHGRNQVTRYQPAYGKRIEQVRKAG